MDNETKISLTFKNNVGGEKKLERYQERLEKLYALIGGLNGTSAQSAMQSLTKSANLVNKNVKETTSSSSKLGRTLKTAFNVGTLSVYSKALHGLAKTFMQLSQKSTEYIENVNLLEVAYKNQNETIEQSSERIEKYIQKMADVYGLDESRLTRQFGIFKQLANAMQLPTETAENLSEIMVKMTNDIASLYNLDLNRASNALQSALAGQVRPIRSATGADITEKTLQNAVLDLGLDRTISELSYVEKRLIMVVSLTNQLKVSQGDYARTIESASNQIRVMHEQWDRLSRAVGNVFYPILEKVLPWVNGILMALTEIFNLLASFLGFKMPEFDYSGLSGVSDLAIDIEDEMAGAGEATDNLANKLKGLRSFDKLNVINTPSASKASVGGGVGGSGYVDPKIMDAFNKAFSEYDDKLDSVRMKASKIKDDIMHWLGFEKEINEETGKIEWKYQGIWKTLGNLWKTIKNLNPLAKTLVGYLALMGGVKIAKGIVSIVNAISGTKLMTSLKNIVTYTRIYSQLSGSKTQGLLSGIDAWQKNADSAEKFRMRLVGTSGVIVGLSLTMDAMKKVNDEGFNLGNSMELLGGTMSGVLGGAMVGATFGGWGAVIGAISGGIIEIGGALLSYETDLEAIRNRAKDNLAEVEATAKETSERIKNTNMEIASQMYETNYHEQLLDELEQIMDANGQIKQGYEDRANFILNELGSAYGVEYQIVDGVLQKSGEVTQSIKDQIALKEQEILLEAYKEDYLWALGREGELTSQLVDKQLELAKTESKIDKGLKSANITWSEYREILDKINKGTQLSREEQEKYDAVIKKLSKENSRVLKENMRAWEDNKKAVDKATQNYMDNADIITRYDKYKTAVLTGDMDYINEHRDDFTKTYIKDEKIMTQTSIEENTKRILDLQRELTEWKKTNKEKYDDYKQSLTDISNYTDGVTPEIADKWIALGQTSSEEFMAKIKDLPKGLQREVISKMYDEGVFFNEELQRGLDSIALKKTVKIEGDTSGLRSIFNKMGDLVSGLPVFGSAFANAFHTTAWSFASGGLPPVGQLFIANERGPELVGQIGGQSFVANQNQMMELLDKKIGNAQNNQPKVFNFYLDADHKIGSYTLSQLEDMAKTNGQAITIG